MVTPNPNPNPNSNPNQNLSPIPNTGLNPILSPVPDPGINTSKVLTRKCDRCNSLKPLSDFDESKYTCRNCTSAKIKCLYCPSFMSYDGIKAQVRKQHPDIDLPRRFSRILNKKRYINTQKDDFK